MVVSMAGRVRISCLGGMDMGACCKPRGNGPKLSKVVGVALMVAGGLMLLIFVPHWVWTGFLAVAMISVGFLLYRF